MDLMSLPTEIRLAIYDHILIPDSGPIGFKKTYYGPPLYSVTLRRAAYVHYLSPALLRVSKQVCNEAVSVLYSKNRFRFSVELDDFDRRPYRDQRHPITVLLDEIGARNAGLLRHVCVCVSPLPLDRRELQFRELDVVRDNPNVCLGITTLELHLELDIAHSDSPISSRSLDQFSERLEDFPSLQKVEVDLWLRGWEEDVKGDHDADEMEDQLDVRRGALVKQVGDRGWVLKIRDVPLGPSYSSDDDTWSEPDSYLYNPRDRGVSDEYWDFHGHRLPLLEYYADNADPEMWS